MKAKIIFIDYKRSFDSKFGGQLHSFDVTYEVEGVTKDGEYLSKQQEQKTFEAGKEYEIVEEEREYKGKVYLKIKPARDNSGQSAFTKKLKTNQAQYSSFAVAYCKDLIIADKLDIGKWESAAEKICKFMFKLDNDLTNGNL
jgi:hypothetical protein